MRRKFVLLSLLVLCLVLPACAEIEEKLPETKGIRKGETLLTVDGRDVDTGTYLYWLTTICQTLEKQYADAEMTLNWNDRIEQETLGDYAKNQALRSVALYATVENWAEQYGCSVTEEDRARIIEQWEGKIAAYGSEQTYLELLAERGLDRAGAERMAEDHALYMELCALAETAGSPLYAADEELAEFFSERGYLTVQVLEFAGESAAERAAEAFSLLNRSADPKIEFDTWGGTKQTVLAVDSSLPQTLISAAEALEPGQMSGILEAEKGCYSILLRAADDLAVVRLPHLDHLLQTAADQAEILATENYKNINVETLWKSDLQAEEP